MAALPMNEAEDISKDYVVVTKGNTPLKVFIAGKIGTGKSSLINNIAGRKVAEEGEGSLTTSIRCYNGQILTTEAMQSRFIDITAWDTPGFGNVFTDEEVILQKICEKCQSADLVIYCLDMRQRLSRDDVNAITRLTKEVTMATSIWKNAIFALTFANSVQPSPESGEDPLTFFSEKLHSWRDAIIQLLRQKLSIPEEIIKNVAIIPAGYYQANPPDRKDWLTSFWVEAFRKVKESALPSLVGISSTESDVQEVSAYPGDSESNWAFTYLPTFVAQLLYTEEEANPSFEMHHSKEEPKIEATDQSTNLDDEFQVVGQD